jgi:hypothetical protein
MSRTFDDFWATTGPWPDNILTSAFKELAEKAWRAGKASVGLDPGVAAQLTDVISGIHGHPGVPCWLGCTEPICGAYVEHGLGPDSKGCPQNPGHLGGNHGACVCTGDFDCDCICDECGGHQ